MSDRESQSVDHSDGDAVVEIRYMSDATVVTATVRMSSPDAYAVLGYAQQMKSAAPKSDAQSLPEV